jgi:hypothetical protein
MKEPRKYSYNGLNELLPVSVSNILRPLYNVFEDLITGTSAGVFNVDLDQPFYCLTDGLQNAQSAIDLFFTYQSTHDPDVYSNLYDLLIPLEYYCNPFSWGGLFSIPMYLFTMTIKDYITKEKSDALYLPIFAVYAVQWYSDISLMYDTLTSRYSQHFDIKNGMYILGKIASSGLLFMSFLAFITDTQAVPRTTDIDHVIQEV